MTGPSVLVETGGLTVVQDAPMSREEARHVALRLLEAATEPPRTLRRPAAVDEALRAREGV